MKNEKRAFTVKEWEYIACPFCHSSRHKEFERFGPSLCYTYVKCGTCGLVYLNPRPVYDEEFISTAYEEYDTESHFYTSSGNLNEAELKTAKDHELILKQIETYLGRKGRLLEIGCMTGLFLKVARDRGWDVVGIDVSNKMIRHVREVLSIEAFSAQYETLKFNKRFDVIYCSHVIEHIPDPDKWFFKFKEDLSQDGMICLNIPNQYSLDRMIKRAIQKYIIDKRKWEHWRTPDHMYEPTIPAINYMIKKHGFRSVDHFTYSSKNVVSSGVLAFVFHRIFKLGSKLRYFIVHSSM